MSKSKVVAKAWGGKKWIRNEKRLALHLRDGFACVACGRDLRGAKPGFIQIDHLKPRSKGGDNESSNLMTICQPCNGSRGNRPWTNFYPAGAHARVKSLRYRKLNITLAKAILAGETGNPFMEAAR